MVNLIGNTQRQSVFFIPANRNPPSFPPVDQATPEGLLAIGGDLSSERLLAAYRHGIFPWYSAGQPILWWSPNTRAMLYPENIKISRSLGRTLRRGEFTVTCDTCFEDVIRACAAPREPNHESGTWITPEMIEAYVGLHQRGYAHSVEAWRQSTLAGGLYGLALGRGFFGESMFSRYPDASKVALVALAHRLTRTGFRFIDCQMPSAHLTSLGAVPVSRARFIRELAMALEAPDQIGPWSNNPGEPHR